MGEILLTVIDIALVAIVPAFFVGLVNILSDGALHKWAVRRYRRIQMALARKPKAPTGPIDPATLTDPIALFRYLAADPAEWEYVPVLRSENDATYYGRRAIDAIQHVPSKAFLRPAGVYEKSMSLGVATHGEDVFSFDEGTREYAELSTFFVAVKTRSVAVDIGKRRREYYEQKLAEYESE